MATNQYDIDSALEYIGVSAEDFNLTNSLFTRPIHSAIHGIGHIYRTMIGCALIGTLIQKPRKALLALCGAYIHDLARKNDYIEPEHGENAVLNHFDLFGHIWDKYQLSDDEKQQIKQAVIQHSVHEWMQKSDSGYDVMAILKDADALDRCRIADLSPNWLRYPQSKLLIKRIEEICSKSYNINDDINFSDFIELVNK